MGMSRMRRGEDGIPRGFDVRAEFAVAKTLIYVGL